MKGFISHLRIKALIALEVPFNEKYLKDTKLRECIQSYGMGKLNKRREKSLLITFLTLMQCPNEYKDALAKVQILASEHFGYNQIKIGKIDTIRAYRSNICNQVLTFEKKDLPDCFYEWKDKAIAEINDKK